jgi:hypothetical protein
VFNSAESQRELRAGDYDLTPDTAVVPPDLLVDWGFPPVNNVGTWFASRIGGNPVWIENNVLDGLCFLVRRGTGDIYYQKRHPAPVVQTEGFAFSWKDAIYCYTREQLASVASGSVNPYDVHGVYTDFDFAITKHGADRGVPRSMWYDTTTNVLYVLHQWAKGSTAPQNVIAAYSVRNA